MVVHQAEFRCSITDIKSLPADGKPEFAVIGRSNVGKSSLINLLTGRRQLSKTSRKPGKTQTINYFLINNTWYLVDLPGYGFARVSKEKKAQFGKLIEQYILKSQGLFCLLVLVDCRVDPQPIDLAFIGWAGARGVPLAIVFTKTDKLSNSQLLLCAKKYEAELLKYWEELPPLFFTSAEKKTGKTELLSFIAQSLRNKR